MVIHFPDIRYVDVFVKSRPRIISAYITDEKLAGMPRMLHSHPHLEVFYVYAGSGNHLIGGTPYPVREGDLILFNAGVLHGEDPDNKEAIRSYCVALTNVYCRALPPNHLTMPDIHPIIHCTKEDSIEEIMRTICLGRTSTHNALFCNSLATAVLCYCYDRLTQKLPAGDGARYAIVRAAKDYIDAHFTEELSLDDLAGLLHANKYYLSHSFKKITHYSPKQYLTTRRIGEAQSLLMNSALPVSEIGSRTGYPDACHFNSIFKKYVGLTPGQYRRAFLSYQEAMT